MSIVDKWGNKLRIQSPRCEIFEIIDRFKDRLLERDYIIAKLYYSLGFTDIEIGAVTRTSRQNISKIRQRIIRNVSKWVAECPNRGGATD